MNNKPIKLLLLLITLFSCIIANAYDFKVDGLYYNILSEDDRTVETTGCNYRDYISGEIEIPKKLIYNNKTYTVTTIGGNTFTYCSTLHSVTIPNSVTTIEFGAFYNCSDLTSISIPNSVKSIDESAFNGCSGLTSIPIPNSVNYIGESAFNGCSGLTSIFIPNSVNYIGNSAFNGCSGLTEISVETNNEKYSSINGVLYSKDQTILIKYPESYETSFYEIPNSVTSIGQGAFSKCSGLTSLTIGNSTTSIGDNAFEGCYSLQNIYCMPTTPPKYDSYFSNENYMYTKLYVPIGTLSVYERVDPWRNFWNIEEYDFSGVDDITIDDYSECPVEIYNLSGNKVGSSKENLSPGIYIMRQGRKVEKIMIQ